MYVFRRKREGKDQALLRVCLGGAFLVRERELGSFKIGRVCVYALASFREDRQDYEQPLMAHCNILNMYELNIFQTLVFMYRHKIKPFHRYLPQALVGSITGIIVD